MSVQWDIGCLIRKRANLSAAKTAIVFEDQAVTYKELNDRVNRTAHLLLEKGIAKGDRVAVVLANCVEFLEVYFACAKLGVILVPLNWRLVGRELEYQLNDCSARMLVFHDSFLSAVQSIQERVAVERDKFIIVEDMDPARGSGTRPQCPSWTEDYGELVRHQSTDEPIPSKPVCFDDPLAIVYTSGVTGNPKGALLTHQQTYFKNFQVAVYTETRPGDVFLAQMPLFHSGGLFIVATPALCVGITIVMRRGFDPRQFARDIERYHATTVLALTSMWRMILESGELDRTDVSSVRCVLGGGERTPLTLLEELAKRGLRVQQGFGQTENSLMLLLPKEDIQDKAGSIGKPGFFTDVWVTGANGEKAAPQVIGEIVAKGPTVMSGYWNMPEATAQAIVDGVLHTGDLGYVDEEGYLYIVDRAKDMYRSGGENVYPAEVEKILAGHPKISNVAIIGVPDEKWGETGMAFVVPAAGQGITEGEVHEYLKGKVASFKHPKHIKFMDALPMTATMKIKKAELKENHAKGLLR